MLCLDAILCNFFFFFFKAEDGIRDYKVTGVQTCALPISRAPAASTLEVLSETMRSHSGRLPAIVRLEIDGDAALVVPIPSHRPAAVVASAFTTAVPQLTALQHVSTVAAMEFEKLIAQREQRRREGADLLRDLLGE